MAWLLLLYRLPVEPSAPRVAVWRALQRLGGGLLQKGVYLAPDGPADREGLRSLAHDIRNFGGEAQLLEVARADDEGALAARLAAARAAAAGAAAKATPGGSPGKAASRHGARPGSSGSSDSSDSAGSSGPSGPSDPSDPSHRPRPSRKGPRSPTPPGSRARTRSRRKGSP